MSMTARESLMFFHEYEWMPKPDEFVVFHHLAIASATMLRNIAAFGSPGGAKDVTAARRIARLALEVATGVAAFPDEAITLVRLEDLETLRPAIPLARLLEEYAAHRREVRNQMPGTEGRRTEDPWSRRGLIRAAWCEWMHDTLASSGNISSFTALGEPSASAHHWSITYLLGFVLNQRGALTIGFDQSADGIVATLGSLAKELGGTAALSQIAEVDIRLKGEEYLANQVFANAGRGRDPGVQDTGPDRSAADGEGAEDGSEPKPPAAPEASPQRSARKKLSREEANTAAALLIANNPSITAAKLASLIGCAKGRVSGLPVWRALMIQRNTHQKPRVVRLGSDPADTREGSASETLEELEREQMKDDRCDRVRPSL
jgi:hypothetical protein